MAEELVRSSTILQRVHELNREFDAAATSWDAEHGPNSARAAEFAARIRYLRRVCRRLGRPRVLDLGCGTGQVLLQLSPLIDSGVGLDFSSAMIECARRCTRGSQLRFCVDDVVRFCSHCDEHYDLVLLIGVLAHIPDQEVALSSVCRVLGREGRVIVISPHPWNSLFLFRGLARSSREMPPARHLSPHRLAGLAAANGLGLACISALPYAPWPALSAIVARMPSVTLLGLHPLTGMVRGAFAAEFRRRLLDAE
jgi:SAM-dependent methyltransferase